LKQIYVPVEINSVKLLWVSNHQACYK